MGYSSIVLLFATTLVACPPSDKRKSADPPASACAKFGQTCEVSPGKLGTCVTKDGCTDGSPACFVCQSQH